MYRGAMPNAAATIHPIDADTHTITMVAALTSPERSRTEPGAYVVVHVSDGGSKGYARYVDPESVGDGSQRWLKHELRGASPGGWSEGHHPRSEQEIGAWRERNAEALDKLLIQHCKLAWKLDAEAPYVAEFPVVAFTPVP